jgi:glycosyltransferase involved in cell wall biosynthesis
VIKSLFSIAMPAYNASATIAEALRSVLAQTCSDWEIVVVDDGSTDATAAIARSYAERDARIRVVTQVNMGCGPARGVAVEHSTGEFVCRLDADDYYVPHYLEAQRQFIAEHPGFDIYACNGWRLFADGRRRLYHQGPRFQHVFSLTLDDLLKESCIFTTSVFRRRIYDLAGGMRPGIYCEDYDFWLRTMGAGATHIYNPRPLSFCRDSDTQMTADAVRIHECQIQVLGDAIRSGRLTPPQESIAHRSVSLLENNLRFRRHALRLLGPYLADKLFLLAHSMAWIIRPYRLRRR